MAGVSGWFQALNLYACILWFYETNGCFDSTSKVERRLLAMVTEMLCLITIGYLMSRRLSLVIIAQRFST